MADKNKKVIKTINTNNGKLTYETSDEYPDGAWYRNGKRFTKYVSDRYSFYDPKIGAYRKLKKEKPETELYTPYYDKLYKRPIRNKNDIASTGGFRFGWNTNHRSKEKIILYLDWAIREGMYVEREIEAVNEMRIFERHEDGSLGNVVGKGNHDDRVVTRGIGMVFCYEKMETPRIESPSQTSVVRRKVINEYTMT